MELRKEQIPWAMAAGRAVLGPVLILGESAGWNGMTMAWLVVTALVSDIFDGVLARRWHCDTAMVRLLDSMSDTFFYVCVAIALWIGQAGVLRDNASLLAGLIALEVVRWCVDLGKFGKPASYHSYLAKAWGLVMAIAVVGVLASPHMTMLIPVSLALGIACNLEGLAMSLVLPVWRKDVKTLGAAWQLRREIVGIRRVARHSFSVSGGASGGVFCAVLLYGVACAGWGATQEDRGSAQETQARGYWTDPSTGLMWAGKDNGKDVTWKGAVKHCRDLRLAGFSDWRLATLAELGTIYGSNPNAPGLAQLPQFEGQVFCFQCGYSEVFTTSLQNLCGRGFAVRGVAARLPDVRWGG